MDPRLSSRAPLGQPARRWTPPSLLAMVGYISLWVVGVFILGFFAFAIPGVTDVPVSFTAVVLCVAAIVVAVAVYRARPRS